MARLTVVKVGGGLARAAGDQALATLCRALGEAAESHPIVVVPGSGTFGDAVRDAGRRFGLRDPTAHRMALLAMDQFGCVLGDLIPGAVLCQTVTCAREEAEAGHAAVLLPAEQLLWEEGPLPDAWAATSDSIAVWVAGVAGGARAVLLKAADGAFAGCPPAPATSGRISVSDFGALPWEGADADAYVPRALHAAGVDAWVVSGRDPDRLVDLLRVGGPAAPRLESIDD
jgi:5-(aminomethyl)-3-furanmethanol phosphate kinase